MPCKTGMTGCARTCRHRAFVLEYQSARLAGEVAREEAVGIYGQDSPEWAEYRPPPVVFRDWLIQMTGWSGRDE